MPLNSSDSNLLSAHRRNNEARSPLKYRCAALRKVFMLEDSSLWTASLVAFKMPPSQTLVSKARVRLAICRRMAFKQFSVNSMNFAQTGGVGDRSKSSWDNALPRSLAFCFTASMSEETSCISSAVRSEMSWFKMVLIPLLPKLSWKNCRHEAWQSTASLLQKQLKA